DDFAGPLAVSNDASERLSGLLEVRRACLDPAQARIGVGDDRGNRLIDLVRDRGRKLPHRCDPACMCQLRLEFAVTPLAFAHFCLGTLALGQVEHESDTLARSFIEARRAEQHRYTATIFAEVLFLEWLDGPGRVEFGDGALSAWAPFGRC